MQGDGTLIDPTCHAEAMANFSTAWLSNSGSAQLTRFNSLVKNVEITMFQTCFKGTSQRAIRGKTNKPFSPL